MVNEFTQHLLNRNSIVLEVESDFIEETFYLFQSAENMTIVEPGIPLEKLSISSNDKVLHIQPLITESPVLLEESIKTLSLEKLIVDVVSDDLFKNILDQEKNTIIENIYGKYVINNKTLKRYAKRRNAWLKTKPYISSLANGINH